MLLARHYLANQNRWIARLSLIIVALFALSAYAEDSTATASTSTSTTSFKQKYLKNVGASYTVELYGVGMQSLTGDLDGKGNSYNAIHYPSISYKFDRPGIKLSAAGQISQTFNKNRDADMVDFLDPYLTVSKADLYKDEVRGISVLGYIRYYVPVSKGARESYQLAAKAANDQGNGKFRVLLAPTKTFLNGKAEFTFLTSYYYRLAKNSSAERAALTGSPFRNDMYFYYDPQLAWNLSTKVQPYVEYVSGLLKHSTNGNWTRGRKHPSDGEYVGLGANFFPTKEISLTSELTWGPPEMVLNNGGIYLAASIKLL